MKTDDGIAIVVLTHNRDHLIAKCVENVLLRTSAATREIVIWDNASTDGTAEYLASIADPRVRVIRSEENVGQNGYARAFRETTSPYLVELDDDVVDAPAEWDKMLLDAYVRLPDVGFLAADLEDDPHDQASRVRHHERPHEYTLVEDHGVRLLRGPAGGGCAMTSRGLKERAGGVTSRRSATSALRPRCSPTCASITPAAPTTRRPRRRRTSTGASSGPARPGAPPSRRRSSACRSCAA
jgi:hypothetical protein